MSSKEQKTPRGQAPEEIITEQKIRRWGGRAWEVSAEQVDPRDEKIANLAQLAEAQKREREVMLRAKTDEDNLRPSYRAGYRESAQIRAGKIRQWTAAGDRQPGPRAGSGWQRLTGLAPMVEGSNWPWNLCAGRSA